MISKNQIKFIKSLKQKKDIQEHGLFVVEGAKMVSELLKSKQVKQLFATADFLAKNAVDSDVKVYDVKPAELERISFLKNPNEALALCEIPDDSLVESSLASKLVLVLDNISDPGNLGTIIRIADWFGIDTIICSENTAYVYNPKVVQATMGSIARVKVSYTNLATFLVSEKVKDLNNRVFGALLDGENIYSKQLPDKGFIVIGNESRGISEEVLPFITDKVFIPSFAHAVNSVGEAESLNAAIATSIICSEFRRRTKL